MTKLLLRLFVKDAQNPDSPAVRLAVGKLAGVVGILCNAAAVPGQGAGGGVFRVGGPCGRRGEQPLGRGLLGGDPAGVPAWPSSRRTPTTPTAMPGMNTSPAWWWPR